MLKALAWKEWMEQRPVVVLGLTGAVIIPLVVLAVLAATQGSASLVSLVDNLPAVFVLTLWPVAAAVAGATTVAAEVGGGTLPFLLSRPVTRPRLWAAKAVMGVSAVLIVAAGSIGIAIVFDLWARGPAHTPAYISRLIGNGISASGPLPAALAACLLMFAAAAFVSTLVSRALEAAAAGFVTGLGVLALVFLFWTRLDLLPPTRPGWMVAEVTLAAVALLAAACYVFSRGEMLRGAPVRRAAGRAALAALAGVVVLTIPIAMSQVRLTSRHVYLWAPSLDGAGEKVLVTATGPDMGSHHVWVIPAAGGAPRPVGNRLGFWPSFSPGGHRVAYLSQRGLFGLRSDRLALRLADLDRKTDIALDADLPADMSFRYMGYINDMSGILFSPDGGQIALPLTDEVLIYPVAGGPRLRIDLKGTPVRGARPLGWAPDASALLMVASGRGHQPETALAVLDARGGAVRVLYRTAGVLGSVRRQDLPGVIAERGGAAAGRAAGMVLSGVDARRAWVPLLIAPGETNREPLRLDLVDIVSGEVQTITRSACPVAPVAEPGGESLIYADCGMSPSGDLWSEVRMHPLGAVAAGMRERVVTRLDGRAQRILPSLEGDRLLVSVVRPASGVTPAILDLAGHWRELDPGWTALGWSGPRHVLLAKGLFTLARADASTGELQAVYP